MGLARHRLRARILGSRRTNDEKLKHALEALSAIIVRCESISRPNGTTNVIARIATAGINGDDIEEAGRRPSRT